MTVSERYRARMSEYRSKSLYNIMPVANISSIVENGILCYSRAVKIRHDSAAMPEIQRRRSKVTVPNGLPLHGYANLYFTFRNPMMYKRKPQRALIKA